MPPSPLLSARSRISTYFSVTMSSSAQVISDSTPNTASRPAKLVALAAMHGFAERVQRARADVAVDDADRADDERRKLLVGDAVRRTLVGALRHRLRLCHVGTSH